MLQIQQIAYRTLFRQIPQQVRFGLPFWLHFGLRSTYFADFLGCQRVTKNELKNDFRPWRKWPPNGLQIRLLLRYVRRSWGVCWPLGSRMGPYLPQEGQNAPKLQALGSTFGLILSSFGIDLLWFTEVSKHRLQDYEDEAQVKIHDKTLDRQLDRQLHS